MSLFHGLVRYTWLLGIVGAKKVQVTVVYRPYAKKCACIMHVTTNYMHVMVTCM